MALKPLEADVAIISKLGTNPGVDDGLSTQQVKERFDLAAKLIKAYINGELVPGLNQLVDVDALRQGISVNGIKPDGNGNVQITVREQVTLPASGWVDKAQTVPVSGVTADAGVLVAPDPADDGNFSAYLESGVRCVSQGNGTLTFRCEQVPEVDLTGNVQIHEGAWQSGGESLPTFAGPYAVTPTVAGSSLPTARKQMEADVTVHPIPYYDVGNAAGGSTVYIGKEV